MAMKKLCLLALLFFCVSCKSIYSVASGSDESASQPSIGTEAIEPLYGITLEKDRVIFKVKSNGCTTDESFRITLSSTEDAVLLTIKRTKKDLCRRMPQVIEVVKELDYLGIAPNLPVRVVNPFKVNSK